MSMNFKATGKYRFETTNLGAIAIDPAGRQCWSFMAPGHQERAAVFVDHCNAHGPGVHPPCSHGDAACAADRLSDPSRGDCGLKLCTAHQAWVARWELKPTAAAA